MYNNYIFSTFDSATIGANLVLTQGNLLLQTAISCDNHRLARSTSIAGFSASDVEILIYSPDNTKPALTSKAMMIGIVTRAAKLNDYVGVSNEGYGYSPGDGWLYRNDAQVANLGTSTYGDWIQIFVDPINNVLTFYKNGKPLGAPVTIVAGGWYFAATVSGDPGNMAVYANTGNTPRHFPSSLKGWTVPRITIPPINIAEEPYITRPTDSLAHLKFYGDLDLSQNLSIARAVKFWMWGDSMPGALSSGSNIQFSIADPYRENDTLLTNDVRDLPINFARVAQRGSYDASEVILQGCLLDHVEQTSDQTKTIYAKDKLVLMQQQLWRPIFAPNLDAAVAGKPYPVAWGINRAIEPILYDSVNHKYAIGCAPLRALGFVWLNGLALTAGGYSETDDAAGIQLDAAPQGRITLDATTFSGAYSLTVADYLQGIGVFGSAAGSGYPAGWSGGSAIWQSYRASPPAWALTGTAPNKVLTVNNRGNVAWITESTYVLQAGRSYAFRFTTTQVPTFGKMQNDAGGWSNVEPAQLAFGYLANSNIAQNHFASVFLDSVGDYIGVFTNTTGVDQNLVVGFISNAAVTTPLSKLSISQILLNELPPLSFELPLAGPGFDDSMRAFLVDYGPYDATEYDSTGAKAIDTDTGYTFGLYIPSEDSSNVQDCVEKLCRSCTAQPYLTREGKINVMRLRAPELESSTAGALGITDFASELKQWPDNAENLTTRMCGGKINAPLSESDFQPSVDNDTRKRMEQDWGWTVVSGAILSPRYDAANSADALPTCFDIPTHGQSEINRIGALYTVPRNFYVGDVNTPIGRQIDLDEVWTVTYPTGGLTEGQQLLVVGVVEQSKEISTVVFWGL